MTKHEHATTATANEASPQDSPQRVAPTPLSGVTSATVNRSTTLAARRTPTTSGSSSKGDAVRHNAHSEVQ